MRIVTLSPRAFQLVEHLGGGDQIVGVHRHSGSDESALMLAAVTLPGTIAPHWRHLVDEAVNEEVLRSLAPDLLVLEVADADEIQLVTTREAIRAATGLDELKIVTFSLRSLDDLYQAYERVGAALNLLTKAHGIVQRMRAQIVNWGDNFYERIRSKRVTILGGVAPTSVYRGWVADVVKLCSAVPQFMSGESAPSVVTWQEVIQFRPDVLIVAPMGMPLKESLRLFSTVTTWEKFEQLPCSRRGEVFFVDGAPHFSSLGSMVLETTGIIISAMAGFESGYITPRDSFQRLRWLELHRHRLG